MPYLISYGVPQPTPQPNRPSRSVLPSVAAGGTTPVSSSVAVAWAVKQQITKSSLVNWNTLSNLVGTNSGYWWFSASNYIQMTPGSFVGTGAWTMATLARPAGSNAQFMAAYNGSTSQNNLYLDTQHVYGPDDFSSGYGTLVTNDTQFYVIAVTKPSGSAHYRCHYWAYNTGATGTMSHGESVGAGNHPNYSSPATDLWIGRAYGTVGGNGVISVTAAWDRALSDAELDTLVSTHLSAWKALSPQFLVPLNDWDGVSNVSDKAGTSTFVSLTGSIDVVAGAPSFDFDLPATTPVTSSTAVSWAVRKQVIPSSASSWNVRKSVVTTSAGTWNIRATVTNDTESSVYYWNVYSTQMHLFDGASPTDFSINDSASVNLGVEFYVDFDRWITKVGYFQSNANSPSTDPREVVLFLVTGSLPGDVTQIAGSGFGATPVHGWNWVPLNVATKVLAGNYYVASVRHPTGRYVADAYYFLDSPYGPSNVIVGGIEILGTDNAHHGNGVYAYGSTIGFPGTSFNSTNYWTDIEFTDADPSGGLTAVTQTNAVAWAVRTSLTQTNASFWAVRALATKSSVSNWAVRSALSQTVSSAWAVRQQVIPASASSWATRGYITQFKSDSYAIRQQITSTSSSTWGARQIVTSATSPTWNVGSQTGVSTSLAVAWAVRSPVTLSTACGWAVRQAISKASAASWSTRFAVGPVTVATAWAVRAGVTTPASPSWAVRFALSPVTRAPAWAVRAAVTVTTAISWNARAVTSTSLQALWNIQQTGGVASSNAVSWNVRAGVTSTEPTSWSVRTGLTTSNNTAWSVRGPVNKTSASSWNVRAVCAPSTALTWNVRNTVTSSYPLAWDVGALSGLVTSVNVSWAVRSGLSKVAAVTWQTRAGVLTSRFIQWDTQSLGSVATSKNITWNLQARVTATQPVSWDLRRTLTSTRLDTWSVKKAVSLSTASTWAVKQQITSLNTSIWNQSSQLQVSLSAVWKIRQRLANPYSLVWNTRTLAQKNVPVSWSVRGQVLYNRSIRWDTHSFVDVPYSPYTPGTPVLDLYEPQLEKLKYLTPRGPTAIEYRPGSPYADKFAPAAPGVVTFEPVDASLEAT